MNDTYDVIVVGAGPAGLIASYELSKNSDLSICIVEKGKHSIQRFRNLLTHGTCLNDENCDTVHGIGGAGLFSDGKLCLSNDVGERLKDLTDMFTMDTVKYIDDILKNKGVIKSKRINEIVELEKIAEKLGLNFKHYDVRKLGSEDSRVLVSELEKEILDRNVAILVNCCATDLSQKIDGSWKIKIKKDKTNSVIRSRFLLVGTGRSEAKWFLGQAKKFNIKTEPTPFYLGIKIETKRTVMEPLTRLSYNPKLSYGQKGVNYIKTHCFCEGGMVVSYVSNNTRVIGGVSDDGENTSFSVLLEQQVPQGYSTYEYGSWLCSLINQVGGQKIFLQRLGEFKRSKTSKKSDIEVNEVQPTLTDVSLKNISTMLPTSNIFSIIEFIKKIDHICPGLDEDSTLIYAPVLEWCVDRFHVGENMETNRKNLYAIGDGSGTTQGIVAAAATGLIAARDVMFKTR